jgi:hypothetical protein
VASAPLEVSAFQVPRCSLTPLDGGLVQPIMRRAKSPRVVFMTAPFSTLHATQKSARNLPFGEVRLASSIRVVRLAVASETRQAA